MSTLTLIRGLPGSGKSILAMKLADMNSNTLHLETDQLFECPATGDYKFDPSKLGEYHKQTLEDTKTRLSEGYNVIVANTFTQLWEMQPYIDYANDNNHVLTVLTCEGNYGSIHDIPDEAYQRMKERWEEYP